MRNGAHRQVNSPMWRFALCLLCMLLCLPFAFADVDRFLDPVRLTSLTIHTDEDKLPDGLEFRIYLVASVNEDVEFTPLPPFDGYAIDIRHDTSATEWQTLANTLASYVTADGLQPLTSAVTENGTASFPTLRAGLYLVLGPSVKVGDQRYMPQPTLVVLPNRQSDGWWQYDVQMTPKWDVSDIEYRDLTVRKVWRDLEQDDRPTSVTVSLYCDGKWYATVILSQKNNWRYTWHNLDSIHTWTIVEREVPTGYYVSISEHEETIVVYNTRPDPPEDPDDPDIPVTGTDWMPVMALALCGMVLFLAGWIRMRSSRANEARE